jgi:hypothetical protein
LINELDSWIDTVNDRNDIITIALGMALNINIFDVFYNFCRPRNECIWHKPENFYDNILDTLVKINFDASNLSIDYWHYIKDMSHYVYVNPYTPQLQQISDLQSVYESQITTLCRYLIHDMEYDSDCDFYEEFDDYSDEESDGDLEADSDVVCNKGTIQYCIKILTKDVFVGSWNKSKCYLQQYGRINNITDKWQILDHIKAAIGPYPKKLEPVLELYRTHRFKFYCMRGNYYECYTIMNELIDFDTIPIELISSTITSQSITSYCAKLSNTFTGIRTKAAKHEDSY